MRSGVVILNTGSRTHQVTRKKACVARYLIKDHDDSLTMFHRNINRVAKSFSVVSIDYQLVNHHLNVVNFVPVHFITVRHLSDFAINPCIQKTLFADLVEEFTVMTFSSPNDGCKNHRSFSAELFKNQVN